MIKVYPDYFKDFRCIADKCLHNCCIGWEIDIDPHTDLFYQSYKGSLSQRFRTDISRDEDIPHFILKENERCPFLNSKNLCDIITETGEEHLCTICREHPRFHNELPQRTESGLGMCCEEAARLILTHKEPVSLIYEGDSHTDDEIILLRDKAISLLQDRSLSLRARCEKLLDVFSISISNTQRNEWADIFLSLERLDESWTDTLRLLKAPLDSEDIRAFDQYINDREYEYEQFAVYLIYRHMANAPDISEAQLRVAFAVLSVTIIYLISAAAYKDKKVFTSQDLIMLCRMYSSEIEYSDENIYLLYDELS